MSELEYTKATLAKLTKAFEDSLDFSGDRYPNEEKMSIINRAYLALGLKPPFSMQSGGNVTLILTPDDKKAIADRDEELVKISGFIKQRIEGSI